MKLSLRSLLAAAGLLVASVGIGRADDINLAPKFDPFQAPEVTLVGHCTDGCNDGCNTGCADACGQGCTDSCNTCCSSRHVGRDFMVCNDRCGGWVAGLDFLMLQPFGGVQALPTLGGVGLGLPQMNYNPAYRISLGRVNSEGLGARIRYFEFDRSATNAVGSVGVEARYLDLEATQVVNFRRWNLQFAGGLRYAEYEQQIGANFAIGAAPIALGVANGIDGFGLTFGTQATRDLNRSGSLQLVAGARYSALYGNSSITGTGLLAALPEVKFNDDLFNIIEINLGPQYRRKLNNGAYLTLGAGLEAQYWTGVTSPFAALVLNEDVGFAGFSTTFAITR